MSARQESTAAQIVVLPTTPRSGINGLRKGGKVVVVPLPPVASVIDPRHERLRRRSILHIKPGQIQPAQHLRALQPDAARINLIPQLRAATAKQTSINAAASAATGAIENAPIPERAQGLGLEYIAHRALPRD
jgi:hypothetical protein